MRQSKRSFINIFIRLVSTYVNYYVRKDYTVLKKKYVDSNSSFIIALWTSNVGSVGSTNPDPFALLTVRQAGATAGREGRMDAQ